MKYREVLFYKDYFKSFYIEQSDKIKIKITWTIDFIKRVERVPKKYFKYLKGTKGLYEIRVQYGNDIFRIFSFFDSGRLIVIANGFQKKKQKTPKSEIRRALKIKKEYDNEK